MIKKEGLFTNEEVTQSDRCIHTPGTFAKQNLMYVQEVGRLTSLKPHRCVRENLNSYLFLVVLDGKGSLDVKGTHYAVSQGDCALIDCMEHYEHISDEQEAWKLAWVHFNGYAAKGYYDLFMRYNNEKNVFLTKDITLWDEKIGQLLVWQKKRNLQAELQCGELLLNLLNNVIDSVSNTSVMESEQEKQISNELRELLNKQYGESNVLKIAENSFGESLEQLNNKFVRQFGISVEEYIINRRFNAAKELLRFSIKPIEVVVKESGIGDMIVMQQLFREKEGMTAEEYRAKWAQWIR